MLPVKVEEAKRDGRHARAERTHAAIVSALLDLADLGNLAPTALEIAERAGVAVRSIRQHFESRESLLVAAAQEAARRLEGVRERVDTSGKLGDRVLRFAAARAKELEATGALRRAASLAEPRSEAVAKAMAIVAKGRRNEVEQVFAKELGALAGKDKKRVTDAIDACSGGRSWDTLRGDLKLSAAEARDVVATTISALLS